MSLSKRLAEVILGGSLFQGGLLRVVTLLDDVEEVVALPEVLQIVDRQRQHNHSCHQQVEGQNSEIEGLLHLMVLQNVHIQIRTVCVQQLAVNRKVDF